MSSIYVAEKDLDKAISEAKRAIEMDPKKIDAYFHLANLYILKKDLGKAEQTLKEAIKIDPNSTKAHYALGDFYRRTGKTDIALGEFV
jgi:tetratricopeptide (TPR) repeat protein